MDIFNPIIAVFDFIYSILQIIIDGIKGITFLIYNVINLLGSIIRILPNPLYIISLSFITLFSAIFIFNLIKH